MPEPTTSTTTTTEPNPQESLGWRAGLPGDLQQDSAFKDFKTVGDFAKHHLDVSKKAGELEGKLKDYVPKLPENATDEERGLYYDALGRPKQPSEYEFDGEDKNAPEWTGYWKEQFHQMGFTKPQAKMLSAAFNGQIQKMVEANNAAVALEMKNAEQKLRSEMGDKYEANMELAKRMTQKHLGTDFDKMFANLSGEARTGVAHLLLKLASLTGEDRYPQAGRSSSGSSPQPGFDYSKSKMPPAKVLA